MNPRPRKRRRLGCLPTATSRSSLPRQRRCLRNTKTTSSQLYSLCQSRKKGLPPSERMPLARRCSAMSLSPPSPPTSPPRRAAAQPSTLPVQTSKALSAEKVKRPPASLRKLLPKIGFSWPVRETRNRHSRKLERRLAGLEGRERRALLHAFGAGANEVDKKVVERGLVSVFEAGLGVLKGEGMVRSNQTGNRTMLMTNRKCAAWKIRVYSGRRSSHTNPRRGLDVSPGRSFMVWC